MKKLNKFLSLAGIALLAGLSGYAQTLEQPLSPTPVNGVTDATHGLSTDPITVTLRQDATNGNTTNTFTDYTPTLTATYSFRKQVYNTLNYGGAASFNAQTTGLVFGAQPSLANQTTPVDYGATNLNKYASVNSYAGNSGSAPITSMFTSNPTPGVTDPAGTGFLFTGINTKINAGVQVFTTAQALYGTGIAQNQRVYFGDLVITFNRPVKNPVIHIAGLGGSYNYVPLGGNPLVCADYRSIFFTTELEMENTGLTSTLLSGNSFMVLGGTGNNNILNNNHVNPNGGSVDISDCPNTFGAASGSIRINGTVEQVVYRVYLQGGSGSTSPTAWSVPAASIQGSLRAPFTGDIWSVSTSLLKPIQQITGHVYIDKDGLNDAGGGDINRSAGVKNDGTNAGGLYANLMSGGLLVASVPVGSDGSYLFDTPIPGTYTVQISTNTGAIGSTPAIALPNGWVRTGDHNGADAGSDGTIDGKSLPFTLVAGDVVTEINFGIERAPVAVSYTTNLSPAPVLNQVYTLSLAAPIPLPVLSGSDAEDMPATGQLTGKSLRIVTLPSGSTNPAQNAVLIYNGVTVTPGTLITNFDASKLQIKFSLLTNEQSTTFTYAYIDAAGVQGPAANYRLVWIGGTLAVDLTDFYATKSDCSADLKWITETEINTDRFEIQVSTGGDFKTVASVPAIGNSSSHREYNYRYGMAPGVIYMFRINAVTVGGSSTFSEVRKLSCDGKGHILIAPNPVYAQFTISGMSLGKNTVTVYSADGKQVKSQMIAGTTGQVNISTVPAGVYIVRVVDENNSVYTDKIIKK